MVRQRDQEDRRFITVSLTESGRAYIADLFPKVAASITRELGSLSAAEQFTLGWLCKKAGTGVANPSASGKSEQIPVTTGHSFEVKAYSIP